MNIKRLDCLPSCFSTYTSILDAVWDTFKHTFNHKKPQQTKLGFQRVRLFEWWTVYTTNEDLIVCLLVPLTLRVCVLSGYVHGVGMSANEHSL